MVRHGFCQFWRAAAEHVGWKRCRLRAGPAAKTIMGKAPLLGQPPSQPVPQQHPGFGAFQSTSAAPPDSLGSGSLI